MLLVKAMAIFFAILIPLSFLLPSHKKPAQVDQVHSTQTSRESYPFRLDLPQDKKNEFATLINLNGRLCGHVLEVVKTAPNSFEVECKLYRTGSDERYRYMVNMNTGRVA